jgi:ParB/RepB/Spo0J family partition protein
MPESEKKITRLSLDRLVLTRNMRKRATRIKEMAASLKEHGQKEPILARPRPDGLFDVVNGSRRVLGAKEAGLTCLDAVIDAGATSADIIDQLVIAIETESSKPCELARGFEQAIKDTGKTQAQLALEFKKSEGFVSKKLMLLLLSPEMQEKVDAGEIPESVAYLIAKETDAVRKAELELMAANGASRDAIAGATKRPRQPSANGNGKHLGRVTCPLPGGGSFSMSATQLTTDSFVAHLEDLLAKARKGRAAGWSLQTLMKALKDTTKE